MAATAFAYASPRATADRMVPMSVRHQRLAHHQGDLLQVAVVRGDPRRSGGKAA
jgi:hypothetical protein